MAHISPIPTTQLVFSILGMAMSLKGGACLNVSEGAVSRSASDIVTDLHVQKIKPDNQLFLAVSAKSRYDNWSKETTDSTRWDGF